MAEPGPPSAEPVRFDRWMEDRLYGPDGFYTTTGGAGRREGDFLTSPEVGPLFGAVMARWIDERWEALGCPEPFAVVEAGAGRGALARAVMRSSPRCAGALRYVTVERSARLRELQADLLGDEVERLAELPEAIGTGVVVANELLDNLSFRIVERTVGGWAEVAVADGGPVLVDPGEPLPPSLPLDAPPGARFPWCSAAHRWVESALERLEAGTVLCLDYAVRSTGELRGRPWLRTYRGHERGTDPFALEGPADITADVPVDQLPPPSRIRTQAEFLTAAGLDDLVEEGRRRWAERGSTLDLVSLEGRSRVHEADALCDPSGLGAFLALEWDCS